MTGLATILHSHFTTRPAAVHSLLSHAAYQHPERADTISRVPAVPAKRSQRTDITYLTPPEVSAVLYASDRPAAHSTMRLRTAGIDGGVRAMARSREHREMKTKEDAPTRIRPAGTKTGLRSSMTPALRSCSDSELCRGVHPGNPRQQPPPATSAYNALCRLRKIRSTSRG